MLVKVGRNSRGAASDMGLFGSRSHLPVKKPSKYIDAKVRDLLLQVLSNGAGICAVVENGERLLYVCDGWRIYSRGILSIAIYAPTLSSRIEARMVPSVEILRALLKSQQPGSLDAAAADLALAIEVKPLEMKPSIPLVAVFQARHARLAMATSAPARRTVSVPSLRGL